MSTGEHTALQPRRRAITPTLRAAALLAAISLAALLVPTWLAVGAALAVLLAVGVDAWAVRSPPALERSVAAVLSRGVRSPLVVRAAAGDRRRLLLRQPPAPGILVCDGTGEDALHAALMPTRRGRHQLPGVASASFGPLGLASVQHPATTPAEIAVYPDLLAARRLVLRLRRMLAGHAGGRARGPLGLGTEFESVREYSVDDDIRQLNWRATARLGRPMSNQYRVERDRDIVCVIDCGRLMSAQIAARTLLDAALDVLAVIALAADELGDRFGAIAFDDGVRRALTPRHRGGAGAIEALFDLQGRAVDSDFEAALQRVGRSRRALVFVHTDLVDEAAARSLIAGVTVLARRHAVIVASVADPTLEALATEQGDLPRALVALDVLQARAEATLRLRRAGAQVLEAGVQRLAELCLDAYVSAKLRARL
jgi:uncharacterized protein (DUF58 family)